MRAASHRLSASENTDGGLPRYQRVKAYILQRIASGQWPEGARIPSENELTATLGVSRMTVHRALRELSSEGLLSREQGIGTFVAAPKPQSALLEIRNIRSEIEERGHSYSCRVLKVRGEKASADIAPALEIAVGAPVFHSVLLHYESGQPIALEDRFVNPAFAPGYRDQDFTRVTPFEYLDGLGPLDAAEHVIEAVRATREAAAHFGLAPGDPCLLLTRRTWSAGLVVSRARFTYPGPRFRLAGRQDYQRPGG